MYKESFEILREINSLSKYIREAMSNIEGHHKRLTDFQDKLTLCQNQQTDFEQELEIVYKERITTENLYNQHQSHLEKAQEHLSRATTQAQMEAGQKELQKLEFEIVQCEELFFPLVEKEESLQTSIEQKKIEFLGLQESLKEVEQIVEKDISIEQEKTDGWQQRIKILEEQLLPEVLKVYHSLKEHHSSPFAEVIKGKCTECAIQVPANIVQQINSATSLEHCSNCGRLFLVR